MISVAMEPSGLFVASSGGDGSVAVNRLDSRMDGPDSTGLDSWVHFYSKKVLSLALSPRYASDVVGSRVVCVGGEECKLMLNRRGRFESKNVVVHSGEGAIVAIEWRGSLIAWANGVGVKVVDIETYQKVTSIPRETLSIPPDGHCHMAWSDDALLIGWGCLVVVAMVQQKDGGPEGVRFATVRRSVRFESSVCGVSLFDSEHFLVMLRSDADSDESVLRVCDWKGCVQGSDRLSFDTGGCLALLGPDDTAHCAYLTTSKELLVLVRRSLVDQIDWLVDHSQFEAAIDLACQAEDVSEEHLYPRCVAPLLQRGESKRAARILKTLSITQTDMWKECVQLFDNAGQLPCLVLEIPAPPAEPLQPEVYDVVLGRLAVVSPQALRIAIDSWPSTIYSPQRLIESLHKALPTCVCDDVVSGSTVSLGEQDVVRVAALAVLHEVQGYYSVAARLLMQMECGSFFPFLARHLPEDKDLCARAKIHAQNLFDLDPWEALSLFVNHRSSFPADLVVDTLARSGRQWQHRYLRCLCLRDPMVARPFGALQMTLTAEFEAHNFRLFLKEFLVADTVSADEDSDVRDADTLALLSSAMELSRSNDITDAEAMLLVWQGKHEEALRLLLERLGDVGGALQLVVSAPFETAETLWEQFLSFALRDPRSCTLLLTLLGPSTSFELKSGSLVQIVRRLPRGLEVPRLGQHIASAVRDAELDRDVQEHALNVLRSATRSSGARLTIQQRRGIPVVRSGPTSILSGGPLALAGPRAEALTIDTSARPIRKAE